MNGDKYRVFYSTGGGTVPCGEFDTWKEAKAVRGSTFDQNRNVRAVWVMRDNLSMNLRLEKFGFTLRRTKYETA